MFWAFVYIPSKICRISWPKPNEHWCSPKPFSVEEKHTKNISFNGTEHNLTSPPHPHFTTWSYRNLDFFHFFAYLFLLGNHFEVFLFNLLKKINKIHSIKWNEWKKFGKIKVSWRSTQYAYLTAQSLNEEEWEYVLLATPMPIIPHSLKC